MGKVKERNLARNSSGSRSVSIRVSHDSSFSDKMLCSRGFGAAGSWRPFGIALLSRLDFAISSARFNQSKASGKPVVSNPLSVRAVLKIETNRPEVALENARRISSSGMASGLSDLPARLNFSLWLASRPSSDWVVAHINMGSNFGLLELLSSAVSAS